jgi:hypothetical protein
MKAGRGGRVLPASIGAGYFLSWQPMIRQVYRRIDLPQKVVQNETAQTYNLRKFYTDVMGSQGCGKKWSQIIDIFRTPRTAR